MTTHTKPGRDATSDDATRDSLVEFLMPVRRSSLPPPPTPKVAATAPESVPGEEIVPGDEPGESEAAPSVDTASHESPAAEEEPTRADASDAPYAETAPAADAATETTSAVDAAAFDAATETTPAADAATETAPAAEAATEAISPTDAATETAPAAEATSTDTAILTASAAEASPSAPSSDPAPITPVVPTARATDPPQSGERATAPRDAAADATPAPSTPDEVVSSSATNSEPTPPTDAPPSVPRPPDLAAARAEDEPRPHAGTSLQPLTVDPDAADADDAALASVLPRSPLPALRKFAFPAAAAFALLLFVLFSRRSTPVRTAEPASAPNAAAAPVAPAAPQEPALDEGEPTAATGETIELARQATKEARRLLESGQIQEGVAEARKAIALNPTDSQNYILLAAGLQDLGKWQEAAEIFSKCVQQSGGAAKPECAYFATQTKR